MTENSLEATTKVKITLTEALKMVGPYVKLRLTEQIKSIWLIIAYLVAFQMFVLGLAIADASIIAVGIVLVVVGLTFFMEGLVLGLMPLGEIVGIKLPQKRSLAVMLIFALGLGYLATLAEPAISVLKAAGSSVKAWDAPLLFLLLNKESDILVKSVGVGVGVAVMFGMLRFKYNWSLKPFIYVMIGCLLTATSLACFYSENFLHLAGLAWDCGAVTTGPVTVPLVLALGIGISRMIGDSDGGAAGFGVVTLASLFPILSVFLVGTYFSTSVPNPNTDAANFFAQEKTINLFTDKSEMLVYIASNTDTSVQQAYLNNLSSQQKKSQSSQLAKLDKSNQSNQQQSVKLSGTLLLHLKNSVKAICLLGVPMLLVLWFLLQERLPRSDETFLGLAFAIIGMGIFSIGIEIGLTKLGDQIGSKIPAAYKQIAIEDEKTQINNFDPKIVQTAISSNGEKKQFFTNYQKDQYTVIPYQKSAFDADKKTYDFIPSIGPLYGTEGGISGIVVVLIFAFILGYGATLAEPALNALGNTVEELTVGTFKKSLLMQAVAIGVGFGIAFGIAKIMFDIPLIFMCGPPYLLLLVITSMSTEEFVNIGWDSAGVTTGPITVPLVLAMGLGISSQVGVVEGFGILSMASVCPILSVLCVGLVVNSRRNKALETESAQN